MSFEWLGWGQPVTDPQPVTSEELAALAHWKPFSESEFVDAVRYWRGMTSYRQGKHSRYLATIAARDAEIARLREALEDCLHRLGNTWTLYGVPMNQWARLKQEVADGVGTDVDKPNGGGEYSWKLNWKAYVKARAALGGDS